MADLVAEAQNLFKNLSSPAPPDTDRSSLQLPEAMPCIVLKAEERKVCLFGMEPGGQLETLGKVENGDVILSVDGQSVEGQSKKEVEILLRGPLNSITRVTWEKQGGSKVTTDLVRDIICSEAPSDSPRSRPPRAQPPTGSARRSYGTTEDRLLLLEAGGFGAEPTLRRQSSKIFKEEIVPITAKKNFWLLVTLLIGLVCVWLFATNGGPIHRVLRTLGLE
mmetsp:Transcript_26780/g.41895  ORF Transcript_26780/g.41895 Transcript_26780/m.41895 type:complete len:221 (-) Transcript_26780:278-940(-)